MNQKYDILIIGGAGYLGSILSEYLLFKGHKITVLDNLMFKQNSLFHLMYNKNFNFIYGDIRDKKILTEAIYKKDFVLPLAAIVGAPACDANPEEAKSINLDAIINLIEILEPQQKIIYPTTNSGYGTKSGEVFCTEETPLEPISLYGTTKVAAEKAIIERGNSITLRLATVFGMSPRMRLDLLVNDFVYKAVVDRYLVVFEKNFKRNYIHIRDVARCFEFCIDNFEYMKNNTYNVGLESANLSKEELVFKIKEYVPNFYVHFADIGSDPDKRNYIVSNEKITKKGFNCTYTLDDGIIELIKGFSMLDDAVNRNSTLRSAINKIALNLSKNNKK